MKVVHLTKLFLNADSGGFEDNDCVVADVGTASAAATTSAALRHRRRNKGQTIGKVIQASDDSPAGEQRASTNGHFSHTKFPAVSSYLSQPRRCLLSLPRKKSTVRYLKTDHQCEQFVYSQS